MFKRYASSTILEKISLAQAKKASSEDKKVSFDYDPDNFTYFRCRAITANETNGNGDKFLDVDLEPATSSFVGVGLYKDHDSDSIDKAIGKVIHAEYVRPTDGNPYIETICAVDKQLAPDLARRVESGIATSVSMGCEKAGTPITLRDGTLKPIEDIVVGDEVLNHFGQPDKVTKLFSRQYSDPIHKIHVTGLCKMPIFITGEHPIWVIPKEQIVRLIDKKLEVSLAGRGRGVVHLNKKIDVSKEYSFEWRNVENLRVGDYMAFPFPTRNETPEYVTKDFARLAGYYIAEGNLIHNKKDKEFADGICLTFHIDETEYAEEAANLFRSVFGKEPKIRKFEKIGATRVFCHDREKSELFKKLFGAGSKTKCLHESVLYWDKELQREMVGTYINGDGFSTSNHSINGIKEVNLAYLETASKNLSFQMSQILSRLGIVWNMEEKKYPEKIAKFRSGTRTICPSTTYRLCFTKHFFHILSSCSDKIPDSSKLGPKKDVKFFYKNYLMSPIRSIELEDYDEKVYNFEVASRNSYLANGFAVHNCAVALAECGVSGCGNIASNPQELCQHMMPGFGSKGRKNPDGSTVFEINRGIQFTELSLVTVPADPTARIFEVYAGLEKEISKMSRAKLAETLSVFALSASPQQLTELSNKLSELGLTFEKSFGKSATATSESSKAVERKDKLVENQMGLTIAYKKGSSLGAAYFEASDGRSTYRVAASDVLPIVVQNAIENGESGVIPPERLIQDLMQKYASVGDFKAWAKRRRKKNRQAAKHRVANNNAEKEKADSVETATPKKTEEAAAPRIDGESKKDSENGRSTMKTKKDDKLKKKADLPETPAVESAAPAAAQVAVDSVDAAPVIQTSTEVVDAPAQEASAPTEEPDAEIGQVLSAFEKLRKYVESKLSDINERKAVKTESNVAKKICDGEHGDKSGAAPAAIQEIAKTEAPKNHMDKGAALEKKAMDKDWAINPKELEKPASVSKADGLNLPPIMSVDRKEASSESVGADMGGKAGANVKKFYNRLPAGGPGEAPVAMDLKSSKDPEKEMLRKALDEEKAKNKKMANKEMVQAIADKVYEVVTAMKESNLLAEGKEDAVIDTLTARFADIGQLENVKTLVAHLSIRKSAAAESESAPESGLPVGQVVPQVFDTVESSEDAVQKMSSIWNQ